MLVDNHVPLLSQCIAIAAAIFGDPLDAAKYIQFSTLRFSHQFIGLWNGTVDVSTDYTTYNMRRNVYEVRGTKRAVNI